MDYRMRRNLRDQMHFCVYLLNSTKCAKFTGMNGKAVLRSP